MVLMLILCVCKNPEKLLAHVCFHFLIGVLHLEVFCPVITFLNPCSSFRIMQFSCISTALWTPWKFLQVLKAHIKITLQVFMLLNELLNGRHSHPYAIPLVREAGQKYVVCLLTVFCVSTKCVK